jgi:spoIIIJ-associated protein
MDYVEAEGHSIDDAIENALRRLGVSRDRVDIEIVSNATRGLFGLGGKRAKVRATVRLPIAVTGDEGSAARPAAPGGAAMPAAAPGGRRPNGPASAARSRPRHEPWRRERAPREGAGPHPPSAGPQLAAAAPTPAVVERGRVVLQEVLRLTGVEATVGVAQDADGVRLIIEGDPRGLLIGRRGQTLDAIEYLVNRIAGHDDGGAGAGRLIVDSQDYRARRREALEALAHRLAERARQRGKPVTLNPLSPRDRRIVHLALHGDPTLSTRSAGTGYYRKLVIVPEGGRRVR